jgi:YggT family protein
MFQEILFLLANTVGMLFVGSCLLRLWMQMRRVGMRNQVGSVVMHLTDWIVKPLRRAIPGTGGVDWASLIGAVLISLAAAAVTLVLLSAVDGFMRPPVPEVVVGLALVWLVKWALYLASLMVLVVAVLSWVNPFSPVLPVFDALTAPLLRPIRQILPNVGRFDLSPLVLFVIIQILEIILQGLAARWIGMY